MESGPTHSHTQFSSAFVCTVFGDTSFTRRVERCPWWQRNSEESISQLVRYALSLLSCLSSEYTFNGMEWSGAGGWVDGKARFGRVVIYNHKIKGMESTVHNLLLVQKLLPSPVVVVGEVAQHFVLYFGPGIASDFRGDGADFTEQILELLCSDSRSSQVHRA